MPELLIKAHRKTYTERHPDAKPVLLFGMASFTLAASIYAYEADAASRFEDDYLENSHCLPSLGYNLDNDVAVSRSYDEASDLTVSVESGTLPNLTFDVERHYGMVVDFQPANQAARMAIAAC